MYGLILIKLSFPFLSHFPSFPIKMFRLSFYRMISRYLFSSEITLKNLEHEQRKIYHKSVPNDFHAYSLRVTPFVAHIIGARMRARAGAE